MTENDANIRRMMLGSRSSSRGSRGGSKDSHSSNYNNNTRGSNSGLLITTPPAVNVPYFERTISTPQTPNRSTTPNRGSTSQSHRRPTGHVNEKVIPDPRYKVKFERHKSLRRNLTPTNSSSNNSSRDDMKLPTSLTSTEKIFKKSQEIIDERMAVSRGSKQSSRSIDGEGSIVLDVDHGLYSPPQLSNNIQSVFIVQSP